MSSDKKCSKSEKPKKAQVSAVLPPSSAKDYQSPKLHKIATKITIDEDMFMPQYAENSSRVDLMANIPPDHAGTRRLTMPYRYTAVVDLGVDIEIPANYRVVLKVAHEHAKRGVLANESPYIVDKSNQGRLSIAMTNVGKEIVVIEHGDVVAQMYIEPVCQFDWEL